MIDGDEEQAGPRRSPWQSWQAYPLKDRLVIVGLIVLALSWVTRYFVAEALAQNLLKFGGVALLVLSMPMMMVLWRAERLKNASENAKSSKARLIFRSLPGDTTSKIIILTLFIAAIVAGISSTIADVQRRTQPTQSIRKPVSPAPKQYAD